MADLSDLMDSIPIGDIASKLGIDEGTAKAAVEQVLPTLVSGMHANASDAAGAASLEKALTKHSGASTSVSDDTADGQKIVKNVFGSNTDDVVKAVSSSSSNSNVTQQIISQVLPIVAPIVLAWLATKFLGGSSSSGKSTKKTSTSSSSGGIGDILGGLLGNQGTQDAIGGLLGGLLGGGKK
ncbi:DUF937 domain-containing protein [soil metagenome]